MKKILLIFLLLSSLSGVQAQKIKHDTINIDCVNDTIRLIGRGKRVGNKVIYLTDKECALVELKVKNNRPFNFALLFNGLLKILRILKL